MTQHSFVLNAKRGEIPYASVLAMAAGGFNPELSVSFSNGTQPGINILPQRIEVSIDEVLTLCERVVDGFLRDEEVLFRVKMSESGTIFEKRITAADVALWSLIAKSPSLQEKYPGLFDAVLKDSRFTPAHMMVGKFFDEIGKPQLKGKQKDEGKFVELPGAEKGKVVVRFPPEASGYLHIGHAKAALLNQYYQQTFEGELIMRFDDTNPAKENVHFEKVIKEDLTLLNVIPQRWTHSSDYFEVMMDMCERLLVEGKAYVDDTDMETMRKEREERIASKNRCSSPETNVDLWEEMKRGSERGMQCCVRIKIDFKSPNGALRDPTIYRCKPEDHVRTGVKYKVYPTYDFACPIVDSLEGVTHALRTTEYHDRDDQYYFICDSLGLRKPHIWSYSRLNMTNTVMSKRKLTWFVDQGLVEGWDDPRLPTVRGVMRHGMTVEGLRQFIIAQGGSRSVVMMEWDKIWSFNKKVIDPIAPRYTALESTSLVPVYISTPVIVEEVHVPLHPKNSDVGKKTIWRSSNLLVEQIDALEMKSGDTVTFVNWGNINIVSIERTEVAVKQIHAVLDLANQHFTKMLGEPALRNVKKGDIIQIQRKGFYICDHAYQEKSEYSGVESPLLLIYIPDGHVKDVSSRVKQEKNAQICGAKQPLVDSSLSSCKSSEIYALYEEIQAQGELVRTEKAKSAKSEASIAAIAKLLELKKVYKERTGQEYKPGQAPVPTSPLPSSNNLSEALRLYEEIQAQGELVRTEKAKNAKSEVSMAAIAKLLELKKLYKEKTGQEYKAGQPPSSF
ncbi:unnamed protein product [Angiostrongylus costaricensis]|uniref:glutamate--tRNA ligase n=1 Tax=Angiostrongylus costaricensis TaxID=334426 RepID=A0A0R3PMY1_ANGCS|nr:unnamed protein product [Angiostrongylus costaricensis]